MLTGLLIFVVILIALLAIPVTMTFRVSRPSVGDDETWLEWAFGLVRVRLSASEPKDRSTGDGESEQKPQSSGVSFGKSPNVFAAIRLNAFRQRIIRFVGDVWRAVGKKDVSLRVRLGLGDPADTGQLWAVVGPIAAILANARDATIAIEPEFFESTFEINGAGSIRLVPLQLIYLTIALLLSPAVWQGVGRMRSGGA